MGRERDFLINYIRQALAGQVIDCEHLASTLPYPASLDRLEKAALIALQSWDEDAGFRSSHCVWERFGRQRLHDLSVSLAVAS